MKLTSMGWYERVIFNRLLDLTLDHRTMAVERRKTLARVSGRVLEIGMGTGLNLAHYPKSIKEITNISPEEGTSRNRRSACREK